MQYYFLHDIQTNIARCSNMNSQMVWFELYTKYNVKIHRTQLGYHNYIKLPLYVTGLMHSLFADRNRRYTGFLCTNRKMIIQLNACQLEKYDVFHIHVKYTIERTKTSFKNLQIQQHAKFEILLMCQILTTFGESS